MEVLPDRIVLNALASPDGIRAHLSKSMMLTDENPDYVLTGAEANVFVNNRFVGVLEVNDEPDDSLHAVGQFRLDYPLRVDDRIRIEASAAGYDPVSSETRIPFACRIERVDTMMWEDDYSLYDRSDTLNIRAYVTLGEVRQDTACYYRLLVNRRMRLEKDGVTRVFNSLNDGIGLGTSDGVYYYTSYSRYPLLVDYEDLVFQMFDSNPALQAVNGSYGLGSFASTSLPENRTVRFSFSPIYYSYRDDSLSFDVDFEIYLLSISDEYYRYLQLLRDYSVQLGSVDFGSLLESAASYTNVNNGFGLVGAYQMDSVAFRMPLDTVCPKVVNDIINIYGW